MKKSICTFISILILMGSIIPVAANAVSPRALSIAPGLRVSGSTAHCELTVSTDYTTSDIDAVIKLWNGSSCVATWNRSGTGFLSFYETKTVIAGNTYTLTADVTVDGVAKPRVSISD